MPDPRHRLADGDVEVGEALEGEGGPDAGLRLDFVLHGFLAQAEGAAAGVVDQHHRPGAEEALGQHQRADDVVGDDAAGVAEDMGVTRLEPEQPDGVDAGVHAGHDGDAELGRPGTPKWPAGSTRRRSSSTMSMEPERDSTGAGCSRTAAAVLCPERNYSGVILHKVVHRVWTDGSGEHERLLRPPPPPHRVLDARRGGADRRRHGRRGRPTASRRSASPTTATCTASSTSTPRPRRPGSRRSSAWRGTSSPAPGTTGPAGPNTRSST